MSDVPRETLLKLETFMELIRTESQHQNLVGDSTMACLWERHIEDALQLLPLMPPGDVLDIGSGAGLPGIVLACCRTDPIHLIEPRVKRAAFLTQVVDALDLHHATIWQRKVERVVLPAVRCVTARAVGRLTRLFVWADHLSDENTVWVLPKGRTAQAELEDARQSWQGTFDLIPSRTDPGAAIVVAHGVRRRQNT